MSATPHADDPGGGAQPPGESAAGTWVSTLQRFLRRPRYLGGETSRAGLTIVLVGLVIFFQLKAGGFMTASNAKVILQNAFPLIIVGSVAAALLISGNVDLSVGGMLAVINVVAAQILRDSQSPVLAILSALALGAALGLINGVLVRRLSISPIIVTLGTGQILIGAAYVLTSGNSVFGFPTSYTDFGRADWLGVPMPVWVSLIVFAFVAGVLTRTVFGLRTYAIGGNPDAASLAGVNVHRHVTSLYVSSGLATALAAVLLTAQLGSGSSAIGQVFEIDVLTAIILGGVGFAGGTGRPLGVLIGILTIGVLDQGLVFVGLSSFWQDIATGSVLLLALSADQIADARRRTRDKGVPAKRTPRRVATAADAVGLQKASTGAQRDLGDVVFECNGLSKRFGPAWATQGISFDVRAGEIVCLVGDNGAGKSTVVKLITGGLRPDEGSMSLRGRTLDTSSPGRVREAGVETVYQDLALCPNVGAAVNLVLGAEPTSRNLGPLSLVDFKAAEREARARLERLKITLPSLIRPVNMMSGGQRQSVAIARVAHDGAALVLLDEPTAALGVAQSANVLNLTRSLADHGAGIIMISHDVESILGVADRLVVLHLGEVIFAGPAAKVDSDQLLRMMAGFSPPPELAEFAPQEASTGLTPAV